MVIEGSLKCVCKGCDPFEHFKVIGCNKALKMLQRGIWSLNVVEICCHQYLFSHVVVFVHFQLFVGLGFPYEGPAPLEAIANGCFFINPKVSKGSVLNQIVIALLCLWMAFGTSLQLGPLQSLIL